VGWWGPVWSVASDPPLPPPPTLTVEPTALPSDPTVLPSSVLNAAHPPAGLLHLRVPIALGVLMVLVAAVWVFRVVVGRAHIGGRDFAPAARGADNRGRRQRLRRLPPNPQQRAPASLRWYSRRPETGARGCDPGTGRAPPGSARPRAG